MANLKEIRTRLSSVKSTKQITSAMKMVAAARLRKAQDKIVKLRPYAGKLQELLLGLNQNMDEGEKEISYARTSENTRVLIIVVTSNRGLCGAFNANVIKEANRIIEAKYQQQNTNGDLWLMCIGKRGFDYYRKAGFQIYEDHSNIFDDLSFDSTSGISQKLMDEFLGGEFDRIEFVYNQFRNAAVQDLTNEVFLPVETNTEQEDKSMAADYIYEPSKEKILSELIPKTLKIQFYRTILDSYVAEHGARMTAMHMATDNASEMIRELTLEYNKARQSQITNQILEVVNGAEALRG